MWDTLCDLIGSTATANLVRCCQQAGRKCNDAKPAVDVYRVGLDHAYRLPPSWSAPGEAASAALRGFVKMLVPLLRALTGTIILRRLSATAQLRELRFE